MKMSIYTIIYSLQVKLLCMTVMLQGLTNISPFFNKLVTIRNLSINLFFVSANIK